MLFGIIHFLFFLFLQIQNLLGSGENKSVLILTGQFENIFISYLLYLIGSSHYFSRNPYKIISLVFFLFLSINQVYFKVFHQNISIQDISLINPNNLSYILKSFIFEVDGVFLLNVSLCFIIFLPIKEFSLKSEKIIQIPFILVITCLSYFFQYYIFPSNISKHPLVSFFSYRVVSTKPDNKLSIDTELYLVPQEMKTLITDPFFKDYFYRTESTKKNVVLIILESVGALQLIDRGGIKKDLFPFLHSLQKNMVAFDRIYNIYPGTTRSHIAIATGGKTPTKSSLFRLSGHHFKGQTIASSFKAKNYSTWLVSAMGLSFEELDHFYEDLNFDFVFDPDKIEKYKKNRLHPWGIDEKIALHEISKRLDNLPKKKKFFLQLLTNSTHYPYLTKKNDKKDSSIQRYRMAQKKTDEIIKDLVFDLKSRNLLDQTLIYIIGDHGESFGEYHEDNMTHRNYLYEENIRNFLLIIDTQVHDGPHVSSRIGGVGDIMPTILFSPQSLLSTLFNERVQFFHKNTAPPKWGLIEGNFKFISTHDKNFKELYNLQLDPHEKNNIIDLHTDKIRRYEQWIADWFSKKDKQFLKELVP
jgi:arylsulfatase A-like enzyme